MSRKTNNPVEHDTQAENSSRRALLKSALVVLGASALVQPNGGVSGSAFADDKTANKVIGEKTAVKGGVKTATVKAPAEKSSAPIKHGPLDNKAN